MTRINLVPVEELSDQHLLAEYHELPRCIKQHINTVDASDAYILGKGHMKWAKKHTIFLLDRYSQLWCELLWRHFKPTYPPSSLISCAIDNTPESDRNKYLPTENDITLSRSRLIEKYSLKPLFYKWTNRRRPSYYDRAK